MTVEERKLAKKWVASWKKTGPILERLRREELRRTDTLKSVGSLLGAVDFSIEPFRPKPTSGLIEQQAWFTRLRRD